MQITLQKFPDCDRSNICINFLSFVSGTDNCEEIKCENNGSCIDALNSYFCKCTENYYGDLCQYPISDTNNNCTTLPQSESTSQPCEQCVCPTSPVPDSVTFSSVSCATVTCPQCQGKVNSNEMSYSRFSYFGFKIR